MIKVIVVEDSDALRMLLCSIVAKITGLSVVGEFIGASTAIAAIRREAPDIVLLDIQLREGTGVEVMRVIADEYPKTKVIVVTNFNDEIYRRHFADAGAHAFIDKSFDLEAVHSTLKSLIGVVHRQFHFDELLPHDRAEGNSSHVAAPRQKQLCSVRPDKTSKHVTPNA